MKKNHLITIIGNIGAGKTTAIPLIAKELKAEILEADNLFQTTNPFRENYLKHIKRWALTNEIWMTIARVKLFNKHLRKINKKTIVIDSGLHMSWIYTHSHYLSKILNEHEWKMYDEIYHKYAKDIIDRSAVISFKYPIQTLIKRIKKRGRDYELKYYTREYLKQIEDSMDQFNNLLKEKNIKHIVLTEKEIGDFENNAKDKKNLIKLINNWLFMTH